MKEKERYKEQIDRILISKKSYRVASFSAAQLAEMTGMSIYKMSRVMKAEYGMSYADVIHEYRIEDAKRLLKDNSYATHTVDEIGILVGFSNRQSFFSAFKRITGCTPQKFRQDNINE